MNHEPEIFITVSKETHEGLASHAIGSLDKSKTTFHADGRVSFPISSETMMKLSEINPDPELAIRAALGFKAN